jgi:hypothetical protein
MTSLKSILSSKSTKSSVHGADKPKETPKRSNFWLTKSFRKAFGNHQPRRSKASNDSTDDDGLNENRPKTSQKQKVLKKLRVAVMSVEHFQHSDQNKDRRSFDSDSGTESRSKTETSKPISWRAFCSESELLDGDRVLNFPATIKPCGSVDGNFFLKNRYLKRVTAFEIR